MNMPVFDADAHVEESPETFSDKYLDPAYRNRRPQVVGMDGQAHWVIDDELFPRYRGRGCFLQASPAAYNGKPTAISLAKTESVAAMELKDIKAREETMDREGIAYQVLHPTLFLKHPLSSDPDFEAALASSFNRFMSEACSQSTRLGWQGIVRLNNVEKACAEVKNIKGLGGKGVVILGTVGDETLDKPRFLPFFEEVAEQELPLSVHLGWACPSLLGLYDNLYKATIISVFFPMLMGFTALITGGILDRFPRLRVAFLEGGCQWIHLMVGRIDSKFALAHRMSTFMPLPTPDHKEKGSEYLKQKRLYFTTGAEDILLPQALQLVGEDHIIYGSDMPHIEREVTETETFLKRMDVNERVKAKIIDENPKRFFVYEG